MRKTKKQLRLAAEREAEKSLTAYLEAWSREIRKFIRLQIWRRAIS